MNNVLDIFTCSYGVQEGAAYVVSVGGDGMYQRGAMGKRVRKASADEVNHPNHLCIILIQYKRQDSWEVLPSNLGSWVPARIKMIQKRSG